MAIAIHWVSAAALLGLLVSGWWMVNTEDAAMRLALLRGHVAVGLSVALLTVLRIAWWWLVDRLPADIGGRPRWQAVAAHWVHRLLYLVILVLATSGIAMLALSGVGGSLFSSGVPMPLPDFREQPPSQSHVIAGWVLITLTVVHVGAALQHQWLKRDPVLRRMGLGR